MHCITFAFLTMFHALYIYVFSMLKSCVLVELDWVEPMMFLLLHVTCSCIFHAYVHLFSIFLIFILLVLFYLSLFLSLSLSLSLSLFLSVSLRMAPKRKSAPSQNPLCSGAASSSDPTSPSVRFRDDKACQDFSENFSRRSIHSEHQVILSDFFDIDLPTVIYSRG